MKKLVIISLVIFASCQENSISTVEESSAFDSIIVLDSVKLDSITDKISTLLISTENASKKVKEIRTIKQENVSLKKELVETKAELQEVRSILADTSEEHTKKKKKSFIQKVISTIKKDTVE